MEVTLNQVSKKYNRNWIFKDLNFKIESNKKVAITGPNGSGKSTLIKLIAFYLLPTKGKDSYKIENSQIANDMVYKHFSIATPYIELIEEYTLIEFLKFHFRFKPLQNDWSQKRFIDYLDLGNAINKNIWQFSSGMKQRLKLGIAMLAKSNLILLDEPYSNLDLYYQAWSRKMIEDFSKDKTLIIASNNPDEYHLCTNKIHIPDFKLSNK